MSAKAVSEVTGKRLLAKQLDLAGLNAVVRCCEVNEKTNWDQLAADHPWVATGPLVAKPDQLIKVHIDRSLLAHK